MKASAVEGTYFQSQSHLADLVSSDLGQLRLLQGRLPRRNPTWLIWSFSDVDDATTATLHLFRSQSHLANLVFSDHSAADRQLRVLSRSQSHLADLVFFDLVAARSAAAAAAVGIPPG